VDGHRFDADPDLNFYFAADPDPDWLSNDMNLRVEPVVLLAVFEKIELTVLSLHFEIGTNNYFVKFYIKMTLHTSNLIFFYFRNSNAPFSSQRKGNPCTIVCAERLKGQCH
jgi:hypothetical protein